MTLSERLSELVRACFTGLWIESHEHQDAQAEIAKLCRQENWRLAVWNIERGLSIAGQSETEPTGGQDPLAAIRSLPALSSQDSSAILVLENFHRFLSSAEIVQALSRQLVTGKQNRTFVIILSPVVQIPVELEKLFVVIEHELPGRAQLHEIAAGIATEEGELPDGQELDMLLDAASGLTRHEAEAAFSLSLVRHGRLVADAVWELKTQTLRKSGLLSLYRGDEDFSRLGGLSALKAFCKRALLQPGRGNPLKRARGVLLLSPPGCGKSQFCKSLGQEVGRPVLMLDVGSLMGSLVGQSEERTRQALRIIDAMAPCVVMIDEVEKAFAGMNGSGDSGVSARMAVPLENGEHFRIEGYATSCLLDLCFRPLVRAQQDLLRAGQNISHMDVGEFAGSSPCVIVALQQVPEAEVRIVGPMPILGSCSLAITTIFASNFAQIGISPLE
ncbi:MAG: ftsH4 2 [Planctomycetaceae bacterium]|nr:ftsH4 2 [Planctomycetaceae bacterium]